MAEAKRPPSAPPPKPKPKPTVGQIKQALDAMPADERALVVTKAALARPIRGK